MKPPRVEGTLGGITIGEDRDGRSRRDAGANCDQRSVWNRAARLEDLNCLSANMAGACAGGTETRNMAKRFRFSCIGRFRSYRGFRDPKSWVPQESLVNAPAGTCQHGLSGRVQFPTGRGKVPVRAASSP